MKTFTKIAVAASVMLQSTMATLPVYAADEGCSCAAYVSESSKFVGQVNVISGSATFTGEKGPVALQAGESGQLLRGSEVTTGSGSVVNVNLGGHCTTSLKGNSIVTLGGGTTPSSVCIKSASVGQDVLNGQGSYGADLIRDEEVLDQQDPVAAPAPAASTPNFAAGLIALAVIGGIIAFAVSDSAASD